MPLSIEIRYTVSHTSLIGVNESLHFLSIYFYLFWNTFGIGNVHKNLISNGQLRQSWHSVSHTFFNETNEFLSVLRIFIFQFSRNLVLYIHKYTHTHTLCCSALAGFVKIGAGKALLFLLCNSNQIMCPMKACVIVKVKTPLVKPVCYNMGYTISSPIYFLCIYLYITLIAYY